MKELLIVLSFMFLQASYAKDRPYFKWAIHENLTHQITVAKAFAKKMKEVGVLVEIKLFSENEQELYKKSTSLNGFQITQNLSYNFYNREPRLKVWEVPFLFRSADHIEKFIKSPMAKDILKSLETDKEMAFNFTFAGGFMYFITPMKLTSFSELRGKSCVLEDENVFYKNFLKQVGVNAKGGGTESFSRTSDYCIEELGSDIRINDVKHNNYFTLTGHRVLARVLRVSKLALAKLSGSQRKFFFEQLETTTQRERAMVYEETSSAVSTLNSRGIKVYRWTNSEKDKEVLKHKGILDSLYKELDSSIKAVKSLK